MSRASRCLHEGRTYHLTHRFHDRRLLLRFAAEQDAYRKRLALAVGVAGMDALRELHCERLGDGLRRITAQREPQFQKRRLIHRKEPSAAKPQPNAQRSTFNAQLSMNATVPPVES